MYHSLLVLNLDVYNNDSVKPSDRTFFRRCKNLSKINSDYQAGEYLEEFIPNPINGSLNEQDFVNKETNSFHQKKLLNSSTQL